MIKLRRYKNDLRNIWNQILANSRNGTFLLHRDYLDYHSERFNDHSFLIQRKDQFAGFIAGNIDEKKFISHQGLTYGGLITNNKLKTIDVIEVFEMLDEQLKSEGISEVIYKPVPLIYHKIPAQEDIYVLFLKKATKISCQISSTIFQKNKISFVESRKSGVRKGMQEGVQIIESENYEKFWSVLESNLTEKYAKAPVHTVEEITLLHNRFPNNIRLFIATLDHSIIAGTILFVMDNIVHVQYISANDKGKEVGALDVLFYTLINEEFKQVPIFDFGHSNEDSGNFLNENLIFQKEGFGGRGVVYETYKYNI